LKHKHAKRQTHQPAAKPPSEQVAHDRKVADLKQDLSRVTTKYQQALKNISHLEDRIGFRDAISRGIETFTIKPAHGNGTSEGTTITNASDWHVEEVVQKSSVNGLNEYTPEIAKARATKFWQGHLRLVRLLQQDIRIDRAVIGLLGDFITNQLHEESAENNAMKPTEAVRFAESLIISGIDFTLNQSKLSLVIPCHSGNHGRTTKKVHVASENGHSLEWLMYSHLAEKYAGEARVKFIVPDGYLSYLDIYGQTVRFHHGHNIKYSGGIGGLFVPAFRGIQDWNKSRWADLDIFGHHHQMKDGGNFISNGSLIGYNQYAVSIKAPFEKPRQTMTLIDKKRGRTCVWPILVTGDS
jgi:hypothetical protein